MITTKYFLLVYEELLVRKTFKDEKKGQLISTIDRKLPKMSAKGWNVKFYQTHLFLFFSLHPDRDQIKTHVFYEYQIIEQSF